MQETRVQSLGWEDLLEKEMATHSSILAWKIHGWRDLVGYSPWGCRESDTTERLAFTLSQGFPGDTSGKEPTCQCRRHNRHGLDPWVGKIPWRRAWEPTPVFSLGKFMNRGVWWATVHGVTKSQT